MLKRLFVLIFIGFFSAGKSQCPQIIDAPFGNPQSKPYFISCTGGAYGINFQSQSSSWGPYTINWGDGTSPHVAASYTAGTLIPHTYTATIDTFVITLTIPGNGCTLKGVVVMEKPVNASIQIPTLGITTACAPKTLTFTNSSTDVSASTTFTWNFGDGTPNTVHTFTNSGQNVLHQYNKGTVNCQTQVQLLAKNYCSFGNPTIANFNPIQIYDVDVAQINSHPIHCWPDNIYTFVNTTNRNCLAQGNTFQRQEYWNLGNYWGRGYDSIINWRPWPPSTPLTVAFPTVGIYSVMLRDSNLCGVDTFIRIISIVNPPVSGIITPTGNLCQNTPITFTNASVPGPYQYFWNFGTGGGFVNLGGGNKVFTYTAAGVYTVSVAAAVPGAGAACTSTSSATVTIQASPVASFTLDPAAGCNSVTVTYTNTSTNSVQWDWNFANGNTSTLQAPPPQNYTTTGVFVPTLVVTASTSCTHSVTGLVTVRPKPLLSFVQFTACVGAAVTFTNNSTVTGTNPIVSYVWTFGDGSPTSTLVSPAHTYTAPATYTVKLKGATAFCPDSIVEPALINVKPTASFVITPTVGCPPFTANFGNQSLNFLNSLWRFGTVPTATSNLTGTTFTYTNGTQSMQNYTVTLVVSTGVGCSDSVKHTLSVRPQPVAGFTSNVITGCSPMITTFTNTSITNPLTSSWTFGDGSFSTLANPLHTYTNTSLFTQTVTAKLVVTNSVGCSDTTRQLITIYPEAVTAFTMTPSKGCAPLLVNFPIVPGVATYTWTHGDGTPTYTDFAQHNHTYSNTGTSNVNYTVTMLAQTPNGCVGSGTGVVTVYFNPVAGFSVNPLAGCPQFNPTFTNTSTGNFTNSWKFSNGQSSTLINATASFTNSKGGAQKTFTAALKVGTGDNCFDSTSQVITVYAKPLAAFSIDTPACTPRTMKFTNNSTGATSSLWDFGDLTTSTLDAPSHLYVNNSSGDKLYQVKLISSNINSCTDTITVPFLLHPKPSFFISSAPDSGCTPLKVFFPKIVGAVTYQWKYDGISFGSKGDVSNTFENKGTVTRSYKIELVATDKNNCIDTAEKTVRVYPRPTAKFTANPLEVYIPNQGTQFTNLSTGASTYSWNFGDGSSSKEFSPQYTYGKAGEYHIILMVSNNKGCRDTFELPEKVVALEETTIEIPNAFTPNAAASPGTSFDPNDKSNDIFHPNVRGTEKYVFSVYSRWGELLFETKSPDEGWDGYYKGKLCTQDVYIWRVSGAFTDGRTFIKTGDVLLLR